MSAREVTHRYDDPLDLVWIECARRVGLSLARSGEVYASTDGRGTLTLGVDDTLDADDCLAQMIFHELCHSLVQGPESFEVIDWGLDNEGPRDLVREHACLRAQALLAGRYGLRDVLAPTTDHRAFFDRLPADPLAPLADPSLTPDDEATIALAKLAVRRAGRAPWAPHLIEALEATAAIAERAAPYAPPSSLWARVTPRRPLHPTGLPAGAGDRTCGDCAWSRDRRGALHCVRAGARVRAEWPACEHHEAPLDCQRCGACCREAYGAVEVARRDPFVRAHPELVQRIDGRIVLLRADGRCPALEGDGPYACRVYDERPRTCRDFTLGSANCLDARQRVGLST